MLKFSCRKIKTKKSKKRLCSLLTHKVYFKKQTIDNCLLFGFYCVKIIIMKNSVIFVDCFNTIICRRVSPEEVIFNWAKKVGEKYSFESSYFYNWFNEVKRKLAIKKKLKTGEAEYSIDEILIGVLSKLKNSEFLKNKNLETLKKEMLELYVEAEENVQFLNVEVVNRLEEFKSQDKKLYVVSDFYCGKNILERWLKNLGINNLFDDIFVSCEYQKSKRTGRLYKQIIKTLNLNKKEILMIGDNRHADFVKAKSCGLKAEQIKTLPVKMNKDIKILSKKGENFLKYQEIFAEFGDNYNYSNYAFPLFLFEKRLFTALENAGAKNVFFLAREGQFLKKLFDEYCEIRGCKIKSHYLQVSRNSVLVASLKPLEEEDFGGLIKEAINLNIKRFLISLNFTYDEIEKIAQKLKVNINARSSNFIKSKEYKGLISSQTFRRLYEEKRLEQQNAFAEYLKSYNVNFANEGIHVVDVGWKGTIQDYITKFFNGKVKTFGYYLGCKIAGGGLYSQKTGLLYSNPSNKMMGNIIFHHRMFAYEQVCRADHNRVAGYKIVEGKPKIVYGDEVDDNKVYRELIEPLQRQIIVKFKKICELDKNYYSLMEVTAIKSFWKMLKKTSKADYTWITQAEDCHFDNFARVGFMFKRWKHGLRYCWFKLDDFNFKMRFGLRLKFLKPRNK